MSTLQPSVETVAAIKESIVSTLSTDLAPNIRASAIAPLLSQVNQWSSQIPSLLTMAGPNSPVNLVFNLRKELFSPPQFIHSSLGIPPSNLPIAFQEFLSFIVRLIEAQKPEKEKPLPKVRYICLSFIYFHRYFQINKRPSRSIKSKAIIDEEDEDMEITTGNVSETAPLPSVLNTDDVVRFF